MIAHIAPTESFFGELKPPTSEFVQMWPDSARRLTLKVWLIWSCPDKLPLPPKGRVLVVPQDIP